MNLEDKQHFDEVITRAIQSGKNETSGLVSEFKRTIDERFNNIKEELVIAVENKIETKVNGKIKDIAETLRVQNIVQEQQSKKIDELKPILERYRDGEGAKRTIIPYIKAILTSAGVIGAWIVIKDFINK